MISVVICSADDAKFEAVSKSYAAAFGDEPYEIVRMQNVTSIAQAYNQATDKTTSDVVVFSHDDIEILTPRLGEVLRRALSRFDVVGVAGTTRLVGPSWVQAIYPHVFGQIVHVGPEPERQLSLQVFNAPAREVGGMEALDGVFIATRRDVLQRRGFDEQRFDGFHLYDIDFTYRCRLSGLSVGVACDIHLIHESEGNAPETWLMYAQRFQEKFADRQFTAVMPQYHCTVINVDGRAHLPALMTPPYWEKRDDPR